MSVVLPYSEACERNKDPILETIRPHLAAAKSVLEIGSGTGQHAVYFAQHFPALKWQPSDQAEYLDGIHAQCQIHGTDNLKTPCQLDVSKRPWFEPQQSFDLIYSANTLHIMSWETVEALFTGLPDVASVNAKLVIYGPFKMNGEFTSASNQAFDQSLRSRGVGSAIRDLEAVEELANAADFRMLENHSMPANNQCVVWQRGKHLT